MDNIQLQWRRGDNDKLSLWINEEGKWSRYSPQSKYYKPDVSWSTNSGFATFQNYLNLSKKNIFNLEIIPTNHN